MLSQAVLNPWSIVVFNATIALPLALAIWVLASQFWGAGFLDHGAIQEADRLIERLGVVRIGWGVVLEERNGVSRLLGAERASTPRMIRASVLCATTAAYRCWCSDSSPRSSSDVWRSRITS